MCARNNAKHSKESDASEDTRCFLITVVKDRQINLEKQDTNQETSPNRLCVGKCSPNVKPKLKNRSVGMASLRQDSQRTNDIHVECRQSRAALSMDNTEMNIQRLDKIQNAGSPPRFITICDRVLANSPSFLVLKDASTRIETRENLDCSDFSQSESCHPQQPTLPSVIRSSAGCQTDDMCSQGDVASSNNSCHEGNDVPSHNLSQPTEVPILVPHIQSPARAEQTQFEEETEKEVECSPVISIQAQLKQHNQEIQLQKPQNLTSSQAPFMTISLKPLPQAGSECGTSVAPCQQFPSAAMSNASSCSFCTSNCCLPRPPQVCQMPKTPCCCPRLEAPQNLGSCLLTPCGYPYCCCSRSISCWPASGPQHQSSPGFPGHFNRGGMVLSNQIGHRLFQPVLSTTGFAPGGSFHPAISPCLGQQMLTCNSCSHYPINVRHYPHCNCAGFVNNLQQCPLQMGQHCPLQMGQQCPLQIGQQCPLQMGQQCPLQMRQQCPCQMGQLPLLGHQDQCNVCSLKQKPKQEAKAVGSEVSGDEGLNQDGLNHVFSEVAQEVPRARTQLLSEDQEHQEQTANNSSSAELPRAYGGAAQVKNTFNTTAFYAGRSGRTCLILRPTATAIVPRLLTRRISRYTSVIMAPK